MHETTGTDFNISMNFEIGQPLSCVQYKLRTDTTIQDVNSAFSPDQSALDILRFCSTAARSQCRRRPALYVPSSGLRIVRLDIEGGRQAKRLITVKIVYVRSLRYDRLLQVRE